MVRGVKFLVLRALLAAGACGTAAGEVQVTDGDTPEVGRGTIRLWRIDASEGGQECDRAGMSYDCAAERRGPPCLGWWKAGQCNARPAMRTDLAGRAPGASLAASM